MFTVAATTRRSNRRTSAISVLRGALDCWRSRRALARLDTARLVDLGLDPAEARAEAGRAVWDVPASWLR